LYLITPFVEGSIDVSTNDSTCLEIMKEIYPFVNDGYKNKNQNKQIKIMRNTDGIYDVLWTNSIYHYKNLDERGVKLVLFEAISTILEDMLQDEQKFVLHGGVVEMNDKAICLMAKSNMGKSTLIYDLSSKYDFNYYSDDLILCDFRVNGDINCPSVYPFPIPSKLRNISIFDKRCDVRIIAEGSSAVRSEYLYIADPINKYKNVSDRIPIHSFILLERGDFSSSIDKLRFSDSYKAIILNTKFADKECIININKAATNIVKHVPVYVMNYHCLDKANDMLLAHVRGQ